MSTPMLGQITYFGGNFAPRNYAFCSGQILPIQQNAALFSILGVTYGGNGSTTFALPDLRGRMPVHAGQGPGQPNYVLGQQGGTTQTTLLTQNLPPHNHTASFTPTGSSLTANAGKGTTATPAAGYQLSRGVDGATNPTSALPQLYAPANTGAQVALGGINVAGTVTVGVTGSGSPISTISPYLTLNALIATQGVFPSRN